jgi:hypothetical protein
MEEVRIIISEEVAKIFEKDKQMPVLSERMEPELIESKRVLRKVYNKIFQEINSKDSETLLNEVFQELMNWHLKA